MPKPSKRDQLVEATKEIGRGTSKKRADACLEDNAELASLAGYAGV
jgi:hypothetical protein